ncbi:ABC transporter substrate-binding protein [Meiothermus granaticius]|uniref:Putative 2-aminoethylphosphonate-binding periplasmic protein n=1 Tax=Meiothermus granaticius NBRC 107808 TaxID=1227551 RepID=A0A399FA70_9DEIN|nr:ABC transporter substrate-binding protein [Meiothermus granaticius]RIH92615.1 putative 2-aminoethylphosphonate-binding periplasmic protein [Meiothermus granaticius NBRC 107808]GEM87967.1 ABC transporter substrate-binding protein [Meiothermus granaticius NBRC 107808]
MNRFVLPWIAGFIFLLGTALAQKDQITLYVAGAQLPDVEALVRGFNRKHPEITVQVFRSGAGEVVAKLRAELEAGNPQPDLVWLVGEGFFRELSQKNLLRRVPPTFSGLAAQYVYEGGRYYEVRLLHSIIAVNTRRVSTLPTSWRDLTQDRFKNQVVMADPNFSGPALVALGFLSDRLGLGYFEALKANGLAVEQSNPVLQQKLSRGEYGLAITNDYGVRQEIAKGAPLTIVYPRDGAILAPTPIGIPTWSKRPDLAEKFLRFLLSEEGQRIFVERGYYPVISGIPGPAGAPARLPSLRGQEASSEVLERFNSLFGLRR